MPDAHEIEPDSRYPDWYRTLSLLHVHADDGGLHLVRADGRPLVDDAELQESESFRIDERNCPHDTLGVELVAFAGDLDPHGVIEHVRTVWMPRGWPTRTHTDADWLALFPELAAPPAST